SSSDYSSLGELLGRLIGYCNERHINISLPSLRVDAFSIDIMSKVQDVKKSSLTFAPEAGTQHMRDVINKNLTLESILSGCREAFLGGWNKVKLYFMLGQPFETTEDIEGIASLANEIAAVYYDTVPKEKRNGRVQITASSSFFVPKPFTAFQWATQNTDDEFREKAHTVKSAVLSQLNRKSIRYVWHDPDTSRLEGVFARGDRRLSAVILKAYEKGCMYDAWSESFHYDRWMEAFSECGVDPDFYTTRTRREDEIFPWDFIDCGVKKEFLLKEWRKAKEAVTTPNCKENCSGCGSAKFGCGICVGKRK
ncbi:MAG: TIGR03960 family B12-binding radical SAM protein, partial [Lachnospiraceae bacterium]|nr:TIGR03960 family B12-binding radical SAM protein [Lachnospiraceae bacterium]